jgi:hypothetical protein
MVLKKGAKRSCKERMYNRTTDGGTFFCKNEVATIKEPPGGEAALIKYHLTIKPYPMKDERYIISPNHCASGNAQSVNHTCKLLSRIVKNNHPPGRYIDYL